MISTQTRKLNIIELVMNIDDDSLLAALEQEVLELVRSSRKKPNIWDAVKPIRKNVTLDQMIEEQNTKPIDAETFFALAEKVGLDDPIEELLSDLTA